jgi:hypothetical protein
MATLLPPNWLAEGGDRKAAGRLPILSERVNIHVHRSSNTGGDQGEIRDIHDFRSSRRMPKLGPRERMIFSGLDGFIFIALG